MEDTVKELFARAQRSLLEPQLLELESPTDEDLTCKVLLVPVVLKDGSQSVEAQSVKKFLDEYRDGPERRTGMAQLAEIDSFIAHVNRFKERSSALFADLGRKADGLPAPALLAVLDYHDPLNDGADTDLVAEPRFGVHRARYCFPLSKEWSVWMECNGKRMPQTVFGEFVEDRLLDVVAPDQAGATAGAVAAMLQITYATHTRLLALSRGLAIRAEQRVTEVRNLASGEATVMFSEEHSDESGQPLQIPGGFIVGIPVFEGGDKYQIPARLRYRKEGVRLVWSYELYQPEAVFSFAFRDACERARAGTSLPLFFGTPEK